MNVLITGSSGFLGGFLKKALSRHTIYELNRSSGDYRLSLSEVAPKFKDSFDLVVHAAGKAHSVPSTVEERKEFYNINVLGTLNLLKGLEKASLPKCFIFISSVSVYGLSSGDRISEESSLLAKDAYGQSKIEAEDRICEWCLKNSVTCTILRLPLLVGKDAPGNLGALVKSISKGYYFNVGNGKARKSMVLAEDVAQLIANLDNTSGIYNLTDGKHPNFFELSEIISKSLNKRSPKNIPLSFARVIATIGDLLGSRAPLNSNKLQKIISNLTFDDSKARTELSWKPKSVLNYINNNTI